MSTSYFYFYFIYNLILSSMLVGYFYFYCMEHLEQQWNNNFNIFPPGINKVILILILIMDYYMALLNAVDCSIHLHGPS